MLKRIFKKCFALPREQGGRIVHLLLLAVSTMMLNVVGLTVASSLFLSHVGAAYLPLSYILMGVLSLPAYTWLSQVVDRYNRVRLCQGLLGLGISLTLGLRLLLDLDAIAVYYALHIGFYFQWILVPEVLFPSLVSDYFTSLDWKRYAPFIKMAMAFGGLLGGGAIALCATQVPPQDMLWFLPVLYGVVFVQLVYLARSQTPLETNPPTQERSALESLKSLPNLLKQYPIIFFLANSTFFYIILYSIAEFLYLGIYARSFANSQELTSFLGLMRVVNNILPLIVLYVFTRPLIGRWGVSRMNLVYPLTTLGSFLGLTLNFGLPAAIFTNINTDGLDDSTNQPIHNLNFNAVPYNIVGQVRTICNGLMYSVGLAIAGTLLWCSKSLLTPLQIAQMAIGFSILFLGLRYWMGKSYLLSLLTMLRAGSVNLEEIGEGLTRLPNRYNSQVRTLLQSRDRQEQILGLELAQRIDRPSQFLLEVETLLGECSGNLENAIRKFFTQSHDPDLTFYLRCQLSTENEAIRLIVLEALIARKQPLTAQELHPLARSDNPKIKALAYIAQQQAGIADASLKASYGLFWLSELEPEAASLAIRAIRSCGDRQFIPLLTNTIADASSEIKRQGLDVLASLARPDDAHLAELAAAELTDLDPLIRAAALKLLGVAHSNDLLPQIAKALEHPNLAVRLWAASALATYGERCLPWVEGLLHSHRLEVVEAAIAAIGKVQTRAAEEVLFNYLKPDYQLVNSSVRWLQQIPRDCAQWHPLQIAIQDFHDRLIHRVLYILSNLDREGTSSSIRRILNTKDVRLRANALETLASFRYRRFVVPILPLFEPPRDDSDSNTPLDLKLLRKNAIACSDHWIRIGAMLMYHKYPLPLPVTTDPDLLLQTVLEIRPKTPHLDAEMGEDFLAQTLFLKTVPFLEALFLDELLLVNRALQREQFLTEETICTEGTLGRGLYILFEGSVLLKAPVPALLSPSTVLEETAICLKPGQYFGEMSLFDDAPLINTAIARADCTLLILSRQNFEVLTNLYPRLLMSFSPLTCLT
ncbi:cyclic nucleotide-binding domain-containing protein [Lusitaniella coriacea LEGE 07157]|uniref:Cyclic nucleotide-binding domain-containing protein n=1 Tax=Lusitaniella coriacea LEGE 07157 TaxID=945747 RepID=A0A8J7DZR7_9CYAN|nr:cyclic nucleotide-binding domain-containing protein [Lusitaniella coriacea]MBE9116726.1 cyclic nucleotide-binding domain-containing protein [Lusitaniella coriacea LEGE 07157]